MSNLKRRNFVLSPERVAEARELYAAGGWSHGSLARHMGVSQGPVARALSGLRKPPTPIKDPERSKRRREAAARQRGFQARKRPASGENKFGMWAPAYRNPEPKPSAVRVIKAVFEARPEDMPQPWTPSIWNRPPAIQWSWQREQERVAA